MKTFEIAQQIWRNDQGIGYGAVQAFAIGEGREAKERSVEMAQIK